LHDKSPNEILCFLQHTQNVVEPVISYSICKKLRLSKVQIL
jgi:hypothetical protein